MKTEIRSEIVEHTITEDGAVHVSFLLTFPRIILAEVLTHREFTRNTSSSRAIPLSKVIEVLENDPFIPIAWQKTHKGMQGKDYIKDEDHKKFCVETWLASRDSALDFAKNLSMDYTTIGGKESEGVTKQLCNRLLEPYMWTTMLVTTNTQGLENFFRLRCPIYSVGEGKKEYRSWKDLQKDTENNIEDNTIEFKLERNKSQAEIHISALAESMWDTLNSSSPKPLKRGQWHIPFSSNIVSLYQGSVGDLFIDSSKDVPDFVKVSTSIAARTSYTVLEQKTVSWERHLELFEKLNSYDPPHSSPFEHCLRAMSEEEYYLYSRGRDGGENHQHGWCYNVRGVHSLRYLIDTKSVTV